MAKTSIIEREKKREKLVDKFKAKREIIKTKLQQLYAKLLDSDANIDSVLEEIDTLQVQLDKMPRNSSKKRQRNRCKLTGRPRGTYRDFKLCRNMIRKFAMDGLVPGIRKSSW